MTLPLEGIRIIELSTFITGPYAGMILGDLGAEVIKVERPDGGDPFRGYDAGDYSPQFCAYNRNKQSITLDLRKQDARNILIELAARSDVVLENFRPGVTEKLGIGEDTLRKARSDLIYCSITGFGHAGPYSHRPAYDTVAQGTGGLLGQLIDAENPLIPGPAIADSITGLYAGYGIAAALLDRFRTGRGRRIDISMVEAVMAFTAEPFSSFFRTGKSSGPHSRASRSQSYAFACADEKMIAVHLSSPEKFHKGLLAAVDRLDLASDERFALREDRVRNFKLFWEELAPIFRARPRSQWVDRLEANDVPFAPVYSLDEVESDPHIEYLDTITEIEHPTEGRLKTLRPPFLIDGERIDAIAPPPVLGEHTDEVLDALDYTSQDIARLRQEKAI